MKYWMLLFALLWVSYGTGMARKTEKVVNNGIPWFDDRGEIVNAHGACRCSQAEFLALIV